MPDRIMAKVTRDKIEELGSFELLPHPEFILSFQGGGGRYLNSNGPPLKWQKSTESMGGPAILGLLCLPLADDDSVFPKTLRAA
ncbi:hypothetical protein EVAR_77168_1 [Eumeta japonica]|uniref:Uncharacterized protein n=1 Tax=Eumeta variegata TaxID=151549 RepID=A0A4C1T1Y3_EUMVA|nr:hypothetical protein EVAR_77168_1 [Eumeta japonica]